MANSVSTLKPDSDATLYEGMGVPYLAIFDGGQEAIIDPVSKLPIGVYVVSFEYTYEEGKEDKGRFIIVTNNTNLISLKEFNYMMPLHLQWGWIYPDATSKSGPLKKVLITGATGFIGQQCLANLLEKGYEVDGFPMQKITS